MDAGAWEENDWDVDWNAQAGLIFPLADRRWRMALSYPDLPADVLAGRDVDRARLCRTFSDCTTAPRNGLVSGCYPLDPMYKAHPDRRLLVQAKRRADA